MRGPELASIRPATERDIADMHRVRTSVRENRLSDPARVQPGDYREMLSERGRGWVAEVDGSIVGFAVADRSRANVWALFVDPAFEGRGLGRRLHDVLLEWLFASSLDRVWLTTSPGTRAERFYRSAGWQVAGPEDDGEIRLEHSRELWLTRSRRVDDDGTGPQGG